MNQPTDDIAQRKSSIRMSVLERRRRMDDSVADAISRKIADRLSDIDLLSEVRCVHAFWPIHEKREVDLRSLLQSWSSSGRTVVLPVVRPGATSADAHLEHRRFTREDELVISSWGIAEPLSGEAVRPGDIDLVLVPALAVDRQGFRIGYGKGFYDRFLRATDAVRVCPVYESDLMNHVPRAEHDEPVDIIVTERRTLTLRRT